MKYAKYVVELRDDEVVALITALNVNPNSSTMEVLKQLEGQLSQGQPS